MKETWHGIAQMQHRSSYEEFSVSSGASWYHTGWFPGAHLKRESAKQLTDSDLPFSIINFLLALPFRRAWVLPFAFIYCRSTSLRDDRTERSEWWGKKGYWLI